MQIYINSIYGHDDRKDHQNLSMGKVKEKPKKRWFKILVYLCHNNIAERYKLKLQA